MSGRNKDLKDMKKCEKCEMYGNSDCFQDMTCKNCHRLNDLDSQYKEQRQRIDELENIVKKLMTEKTTEELNGKAEREEAIKNTIEEKEEVWTTIVSKKVDKELKLVNEKVKIVEEKMKIHEEENRQKELKKNNIIIHRMAESTGAEDEKKNEDRKAMISLINDILKVPCEGKDIKKIFRLGKMKDSGSERPILIEFQEGTMKNAVLENLSKLRQAEEKYRKISVTHDMTTNERDQCRELVKKCKEDQSKEKSGEWIFKVRGPPGAMRIVKMKKY